MQHVFSFLERRHIFSTVLAISFCVAANAEEYDLLVTGGMIVDGSGNERFTADIAILGGRIARIGDLREVSADRTIDATGKIIIPGFIDVHGHADDHEGDWRGIRSQSAEVRAATPNVSQGITTSVANSDGLAPLIPLADQMADAEGREIGLNVAYMASHNRVRFAVLGHESGRPATSPEIARMKNMLAADMDAGAFGLAAVLEYADGRWSTTEELLDLTKILSNYDGVFIAHPRSQSKRPAWWLPSQNRPPSEYPLAPTMLAASQELIQIAEANKIRVSISHISMRGPDPDRNFAKTIDAVNAARDRGVWIFADQNPYRANPIGVFTPLVPYWALTGKPAPVSMYTRSSDPRKPFNYKKALLKNLKDPTSLSALREDVGHRIEFWGGADQIRVTDNLNQDYIGRTLAEIAAMRATDPVSLAIQLAVDGDPNFPGGFGAIGYFRSDQNIGTLVKSDWVAGDTDASIRRPFMPGYVHPRMYGSYPHWLRRYVLDQQLVSLEFAVHNLTKLAADIVGLTDRGQIKEGLAADFSIVNLDELYPRSTFYDVHQYADGFDYVFVNGTAVVAEGKLTWALPGQVLRKPVARK